jgi:DNA/RNA endonuclease YhcR with UshA esterase domain
MTRKCFVLLLLLTASVGLHATNNLTADEARNHIGETATVCGVAASVHTASNSQGTPTFVNLDKAYPAQVFTILIWGEDLGKFSPKPSAWAGKRVCATGTITSYRGSPEIVVKTSAQIVVAK